MHKELYFGARALFFALLCAMFVFTPRAVHASCTEPPVSGGGYFFESYERVEYGSDGFLIIHLKLKPTYNDGRAWFSRMSIHNDECQNATVTNYGWNWVTLPAHIGSFSVRFSSDTHFDLWNDDTNTKLTCSSCGGNIAMFPAYTKVSFRGFVDGGASSVQSGFYTIRNNVLSPPIRTETLATPQGCATGTISGSNPYLFDSYEHTEYKNGLLQFHLRFKSPYNDGRTFPLSIRAHGDTCALAGGIGGGTIGVTPYVRYYSIRFSSPTHYAVWNDETEAPLSCVGCAGDISTTSPAFVSLYAYIDAGASSIVSTPFPIEEYRKPNPVVIIPGILGSWDKDGIWLIDPVFHTYDDLIATLVANGYEEEKTLFTLPYDWRNSNTLTAVALRNKLREIKQICQCGKVDVVAHSMGGLVARQYIQTSLYENDVDKLVFLGTPQLGAPKAYLAWEGGVSGFSLADETLDFILSREAKKSGYTDLFSYIRLKPISSIQQLLSTENYLLDKGSTTTRIYPNGYPRNDFLQNLNGTRNILDESGTHITSIIGNTGNSSTTKTLRVVSSIFAPKWFDGYPEGFLENSGDRGIIRDVGDGTVPLTSASYLGGDVRVVNIAHRALPNNTSDTVYKILARKNATTVVHHWPSVDIPLLFIKILSPVDVQIIAPDGKRVGKDFSTGGTINEIPDAFYSGFSTDDEYVVIPNPQEGSYHVNTIGTGNGGQYTIATGYFGIATSSDIDFVGYTLPSATSTISIIFSSTSTTPVTTSDTSTLSYQDVIAHIHQMRQLGWVTTQSLENKLVKFVEKILKKEDKPFKLEKSTEKFLNELQDGFQKQQITKEGFELLKHEIQLAH